MYCSIKIFISKDNLKRLMTVQVLLNKDPDETCKELYFFFQLQNVSLESNIR